MKYPTTGDLGQSYKVTRKAPLDGRLVQNTILDLTNPASFGASSLQEYRYKGIIVAVVEDKTSNNGIYILKGNNPNELSSWEKIGLPELESNDGSDYYLDYNNGNPQWKKVVTPKEISSLSDLEDVDLGSMSGKDGYVLKYDESSGKWIASLDEKGSESGIDISYEPTITAQTPGAYEIGTLNIDGDETIIYGKDLIGSGSGGECVTTASINYNKLFDDTASGGLNLQERHDMGFLERSSFSHNGQSGVIPPNTSYESIFRKMFCGVTASVTGNLNYSTTWDGTSKSYNNNVSPVANPTGAVLKYSIGTNSSAGSNWMNYSGSSITATNVSETPKYIWFKSVYTDGTDTAESSAAKGTFTISKRPSTITPTTSKNTYTIGETLVLGTPTISNIASNVSPTASDIQNEVTYNIQNNSTLNTVGNINITISNISYLNSTYPNYNFSSGSNTITVYPVIQYKTLLDSDWCNYLTSYSAYNSGTYSSSLSTYQVSKNSPANSYMLPLISQKVPTSNNFKLRIKKPYHLANTKYDFDTPNNNWKAVAATAFTEFNLISSSGDYNEYQYIGNDVATPLAITIEK